MKYLSFVISMAMFLVVSCKKDSYTNATIVKNCTGTYLQVLDRTYRVCNVNKTASFENEQKVLASFKLTKACENDNPIPATCYMLYQNDGLINIANIKKL